MRGREGAGRATSSAPAAPIGVACDKTTAAARGLLYPDSAGRCSLGARILSRNNPAMLKLALILFVVAIVAALVGFGGLADFAYWAAGVAAIIGVVLLIIHLVTGRTPAV